MPVIDAVSADYQDTVTFLAVAGRSTLEASAAQVGTLFSPDRLMWGYSDELFDLLGIPGQPVTVLVTSDGYEVRRWFGTVSESEMRAALDELVAYG